MTNAPVAGWYDDPQVAGRYRYWDGTQWTEHLAAPPTTPLPAATPLVPPAVTRYAPQPYPRFGVAPTAPNATLYTNPYQKPPRTKQRLAESSLSPANRIRAAAIDAALAIPFVIIGFVLGPLLGWVSGNSGSQHHAYQSAAIVLSVVLGVGTVAWNLLIRETTLGTEVASRRAGNEESKDQAP